MTDISKPFTSAELSNLKAKAKAATPTEGSTLFRYEHGGGRLFVEHNEKDRTLIIDSYHKGDREFYYAANPETVLRLIDMIERQHKALLEIRSINSCTDSRNAARSEILRITSEAFTATEPPK